MARKPEATFVQGVHRYLDTCVYQEGIAQQFTNGTPDRYYEGSAECLWVEYKWLPQPRRVYRPADFTKKSGHLSALQLNWIDRADANHQPVAVIIGWPDGGVIMTDRQWHEDWTKTQFVQATVDRRRIAEWIGAIALHGWNTRHN